MMRGGRGWRRLGPALIASAVLHLGAIGGFWVFAARGAELAPFKVYAVNIVSPPPRAAGEVAPERAPAEAEPEPEPLPPAPEPEPPAPTPPEPRAPEPAPPEAAAPPRAQRPAAPRPAPREPTPAPTRPAEPAPQPAPSTGPAPSPASPGGENLAVRTEGAVCPSEAYCANIAATVRRYFRRPPDSYSDRGDICFRIARSGSVSELEVQRLRGSFAFRLSLMEAVEQAGRRDEFGPLPREFGSDWLPVCVGVSPQM